MNLKTKSVEVEDLIKKAIPHLFENEDKGAVGRFVISQLHKLGEGSMLIFLSKNERSALKRWYGTYLKSAEPGRVDKDLAERLFKDSDGQA